MPFPALILYSAKQKCWQEWPFFLALKYKNSDINGNQSQKHLAIGGAPPVPSSQTQDSSNLPAEMVVMANVLHLATLDKAIG